MRIAKHGQCDTPFPIGQSSANHHIVVGGGLAGCLLARRFLEHGADITLFHAPDGPCASNAAAGIINPVTGRWMTKSWRFDDCFPEARSVYGRLERELGARFFRTTEIHRYCLDEADAKRARRRAANPHYADVVTEFSKGGDTSPMIVGMCGRLRLRPAARVDLPRLRGALLADFRARGRLCEESFDHARLRREPRGWRYGGLRARTVTFCEGSAIRENPWFRDLPFRPAKGETVRFACPGLRLPDAVHQHRKWIFPLADGTFRAGATFVPGVNDPSPTEAGAREILDAVAAFTPSGSQPAPLGQSAGVRPCSVDAKPILGPHPEQPGLYLLNGLGAKGATTAPLMSALLARQILQGAPPDPALSPQRFS